MLKKDDWIDFKEDYLNARAPLLFGPGLCFLLLGFTAVFAPTLLIAAVAGFLLFLGVLFCYLAWKFIKLQKHFDEVLSGLKDKVQIQAFQVNDSFDSGEPGEPGDDPKIIIH